VISSYSRLDKQVDGGYLGIVDNLHRLIRLAKLVRQQVRKELVPYYYSTNMAGACGVSSVHLMRCARKIGIKVQFKYGFYNGSSHAWIEYRGKIIDLTVSQFNNRRPDIFVTDSINRNYVVMYSTSAIMEARNRIASWSVYPDPLHNNLLEKQCSALRK
jgi:hypothetical protein